MTDKACELNHRVHTNTGTAVQSVSVVFDHLCGGEGGVQCRRVDRNGNPVGDDQFAFNPGEAVAFELYPGDGINMFCNGGDSPCSYRVMGA
ncbi:MAG: hypothetical protein JO055_10420 [Alphaproteobacteria bacterium]|nr:hypothetical protein [Alphaproteobacteria bacterium]